MKVFITICSKHKDADPELLLAHERYLGEHIKITKSKAKENDTLFYILSGKYGLISGDDFIPDYDYYLENETQELIQLVKSQILEAGITDMEFYYQDKETWKPYILTLNKAATLAGVQVCRHKI